MSGPEFFAALDVFVESRTGKSSRPSISERQVEKLQQKVDEAVAKEDPTKRTNAFAAILAKSQKKKAKVNRVNPVR